MSRRSGRVGQRNFWHYQVIEVSVRFSVIICLIMGCLIFCRGYLLNRKVITEKSNLFSDQKLNYNTTLYSTSRGFRKIILVLVDALRFDFIHRMKFIKQKLNASFIEKDSTACPFKFVADPPTTTMQRLKALTTGTLPTFIDVSSNFNSYEIEEDNLIYQFHNTGLKIGFVGDDTWINLFQEKYFTVFLEALPSFNAWDLDTVDRTVNETMHSYLSMHNSHSEWDVLIAHYLGIDHCGHRYGPNHKEMERKLDEVDASLQFIYNTMNSDTLLAVFGDHGMTATGDHGGDSTDEVEASIIFLTKNNFFSCNSNINDMLTISQIDLVPTIAILMQIPIPYSSIGQIIPNLFQESLYTEAIFFNVLQVNRYVKTYSFDTDAAILNEIFQKVLESYEKHKLYNLKSTQNLLNLHCVKYLNQVKSMALSLWTQFDDTTMFFGISICLLSVGALFLWLTRHQENKLPRLLQIIDFCPLLGLLICGIWNCILGFGIFGIIGVLLSALSLFIVGRVYLFFKMSEIKVRLDLVSIFGVAIPFMVYVFTCFGVMSNSFIINEGFILGCALVLLGLLHCLLFKPNRSRVKTTTSKTKIIVNKLTSSYCSYAQKDFGIWNSWLGWLCLVFIVKISQLFFRCREELTSCNEEYLLHKHLPSLPSQWVVHKYIRYSVALISLAVLVVLLRIWMGRRKCVLSLRPGALIGKYVPSVLVVLLCVYWALQGLFDQFMQLQLRSLLHYFPLVFQLISISSMIILWWKPLCCIGRLKVKNNDTLGKGWRKLEMDFREITACSENDIPYKELDEFAQENTQNGISSAEELSRDESLDEKSDDVHLSSLLTLGIVVTLLLVHVSSIGLAPIITFIPYSNICLLYVHGRSSHLSSWSSVISWTLGSQYFFYSTGHQPIFSTIPWDSAFISEGTNTFADTSFTWISWIKPAVAVMCNIHVSQIVFSISLPLLILWKGSFTALGKKHSRIKIIFDLYTKFIILHSLKLLATMLCVAVHRRHLMVWKIFTPKFIYEGISFIVIYFITSLSILFIIRVDFLLEKARTSRRKIMQK